VRVDRDNPAVAAVRAAKAAVLAIELDDGSTRKYSMPKAGNRWDKLGALLDQLPWARIEMFAADGTTLLGVVEEDEPDEDEPGSAPRSELRDFARLLAEVQRTTMKETREMFSAQMRGTTELVAALIEGQRALSDSYTLALRVQAANIALPQGQEEDATMKMLSMAMMLKGGGTHAPPPPPPPPPKKVP
jgi:hypothetical protein